MIKTIEKSAPIADRQNEKSRLPETKENGNTKKEQEITFREVFLKKFCEGSKK